MVLQDMYAQEKFLFHLDWLLSLEKRHSNVLQSGLVHISLDHSDVLGLTFGAGDAAHKLSELTECLQKSFRSTDLVMRRGLNFLIITPFTQLDPVVEKVRRVLSTAPSNGLEIAQSDVTIFLLQDHVSPDQPECGNAEDFVEYILSLSRSNPIFEARRLSPARLQNAA